MVRRLAWLIASVAVLGSPVSLADDGAVAGTTPSLSSWARSFTAQYCPRSCELYAKQAADAHDAQVALGPRPKPSDHTASIILRAETAARDRDACLAKMTAEHDALVAQLDSLDCDHAIAVSDRPAPCVPEILPRGNACRASREAEKQKREADIRAKAAAEAAEHDALMHNPRVMLLTFSAALCSYAKARAAVATSKDRSAVLAPLNGSKRTAEELQPAARIARIDNLAARTRAELKLQWKIPPIPCTDTMIAHISDCLWLEEFRSLGADAPEPLPVDRCGQDFMVKVRQVGSLLGVPAGRGQK